MDLQAIERVFVALDTSDLDEINRYAQLLGEHVGGFKIGRVSIERHGIDRVLTAIMGYGPACKNVFADQKPHDIPTVMVETIEAAVKHQIVAFINVHTDAGTSGMQAVAAAKKHAKLLGVTALTSMDEHDLAEVYGSDYYRERGDFRRDSRQFVLDRTFKAKAAGCDGVVCSPQEVSMLKASTDFPGFVFMTPGVRPSWAAANDQKRVMTPGEAVREGSTYVVIGRPILRPPDGMTPVEAARRIVEEIEEAMAR